ncbi:hypothetical protein L210DRAFT_3652148 [Boletus edulis BED1]|uniref:Uncharacterized protein n=1 Tax=Boletus edulis BED1 TaxID=1328754 RepID=A0AAD4BGW4_BOLED|nr:hypothetical protein L210DRAFT_3652148 [Boletus edulis BED1]
MLQASIKARSPSLYDVSTFIPNMPQYTISKSLRSSYGSNNNNAVVAKGSSPPDPKPSLLALKEDVPTLPHTSSSPQSASVAMEDPSWREPDVPRVQAARENNSGLAQLEARPVWQGDWTRVEDLLAQDIMHPLASDPLSHARALALRALVQARLKNCDMALNDAKASLGIQGSVIGHVSHLPTASTH